MKESINKEICRLARVEYYGSCSDCKTIESCRDTECFVVGADEITIDILVRAMWAINREGIYEIDINSKGVFVWDVKETLNKNSYYKDFDNEQSALQSAIEYVITEQSK